MRLGSRCLIGKRATRIRADPPVTGIIVSICSLASKIVSLCLNGNIAANTAEPRGRTIPIIGTWRMFCQLAVCFATKSTARLLCTRGSTAGMALGSGCYHTADRAGDCRGAVAVIGIGHMGGDSRKATACIITTGIASIGKGMRFSENSYFTADQASNCRGAITVIRARNMIGKNAVFFSTNRTFCFFLTGCITACMRGIFLGGYLPANRASNGGCAVSIIRVWNVFRQRTVFLITNRALCFLLTGCTAACMRRLAHSCYNSANRADNIGCAISVIGIGLMRDRAGKTTPRVITIGIASVGKGMRL